METTNTNRKLTCEEALEILEIIKDCDVLSTTNDGKKLTIIGFHIIIRNFLSNLYIITLDILFTYATLKRVASDDVYFRHISKELCNKLHDRIIKYGNKPIL